MRIMLIVQYDGTAYCGWQSQQNGLSVQAVIEAALEDFCGAKIRITASGRTDSGVHARAAVVHFDTDLTLPDYSYAPALNCRLPGDIQILESKTAPVGFHARYLAKRKTYAYRVYRSDRALPLKSRYAVRVQNFNAEKMREASKLLLGKHDFKAFSASGSSVKNTVRVIYSCEIEESGNDLTIYICGNGFLYNMVRIIVGTLLKYSDGKISLGEIKASLSDGDRGRLGKTMPPNGLTLESVEYDN